MAHKAEGAVKELPTFLDLLGLDMDQTFLDLTLHQWMPVVMSGVAITFLVLFCYRVTRNLKKVPGSQQALLELTVEGLEGFVKSQMGKVGGSFVPFIGTLFIYIWVMNLMGQVPLFHSPTADYNTTLALTMIVFLLTHYYGLKNKGPIGYFKHFMGEPMWLAPMLLPIHLVQEFIARPLTLSLRLFGNLTGEHTILAIGIGFSPFIFGFIPIPVQVPAALLDLLLATLQAGIFAVLACFYIAGAMGALEEH